MKHHSHNDIINRLRRAEGHLHSVIAMIEQGRPCVDVGQQLYAVERAISSAKTEFIRDHIEHCLDGATEASVREFVDELKVLTKYI